VTPTPGAPAAEPAGALRRALEALYDGTAALAAACLVGLLAMVLLSIVSRQLNFHVPGTDAYAGYLMAAAGFLALAHTLKRGEHIRVTLLIGTLRGRARHALEVWCLVAASALAGLLAFYSARLAWQSRVLNDVSTASDATPLWLPQLAMAFGTLVLLVAFVDELVLELQGRRHVAGSDEALHNE
jgi:TRAP-type C4-dicarboxylate transport system permease small subunit